MKETLEARNQFWKQEQEEVIGHSLQVLLNKWGLEGQELGSLNGIEKKKADGYLVN